MKENKNKIKCDQKINKWTCYSYILSQSIKCCLSLFHSILLGNSICFPLSIMSLFTQIEIKMLTHSEHLMHLRLDRNEMEIYATTTSASLSLKSQHQSSKLNFVQVKILILHGKSNEMMIGIFLLTIILRYYW